MQTFTATFANGKTITRNNKTGRTYTHGWATFFECGGLRNVGFSASAAAAERAARAQMGNVGAVRYEVAPAVQA